MHNGIMLATLYGEIREYRNGLSQVQILKAVAQKLMVAIYSRSEIERYF